MSASAVAPTLPAQTVAAHVRERADDLAGRFASAAPFRHVVIDDFLAPEFARALLDQFPSFDRANSVGEDGRPGGKGTFERIRQLGPAYAQLDDVVSSAAFARLIERITGIDDLLYDPWYLGGGTHENRDGAGLEAHIDFNFHPLERWQRRLNLIVYLNPQWEAGWGGELHLHRDPSEGAPPVSIVPAFNRCVIFETNDHSWHGFDPIRLPADQAHLTRRSIALYFYTRPAEDAAAPERAHSTVYVSRALPEHLVEGRALTAQDLATLQSLLRERDARIAFQYDEIAKLMTLLKSHERGLAGYLAFLARKAYARLRLLRQGA